MNPVFHVALSFVQPEKSSQFRGNYLNQRTGSGKDFLQSCSVTLRITQVLISAGSQRIKPPVIQDTPTTMDNLNQSLAKKAEEARDQLDAHVREIIQWHFSPETGAPFWLEYAETLDFDPRDKIGSYDDLKLLGHFQDEWLRGGPVRRWVPRGYADQPVYVFETGGSTGVPKTRISIRDFQIDYEMFSETLPDESFPPGSDWLMLGPSGPRRLRLAVEYLAQHRGGICFLVDLDPRWVNKLIQYGKHQELDLYKNHVIDQALNILRAHDNIQCLFTTPKLLEALSEKISLPKAGIKGIFCGGTEMDAQFTASLVRSWCRALNLCRRTETRLWDWRVASRLIPPITTQLSTIRRNPAPSLNWSTPTIQKNLLTTVKQGE